VSGDPSRIRTCNLRSRNPLRVFDIASEFALMSPLCRNHAATIAASIFFMASRSAALSWNRWP
jgi:hypothetical protein